MRKKLLIGAAAITAATMIPSLAVAATASAITDLNIRSGPGPQYSVIGAIQNGDRATVRGCIEGSLWCEVVYNGKQGWAYSKYLTMPRAEKTVIIADQRAALDIPTVTYEAPASKAGDVATGAATGALAGALIGGPIGAAVGGTVGAAVGSTVNPPVPVHTYVTEHPVDPVYLNGEVVVGAGVPDTVTLRPVPDYDYDYAYVNRVPVLVDRGSRRIVYVYR